MKRVASLIARTAGGFVGGTAVAAVAALWGVMDDKRAREIAARADTGDCCRVCGHDFPGENR